MKRTNLNFIFDAVAFIGFVMLTTTGVLMRYILPPGSGHRTTLWSLDRHEWGDIHFWISIIFFFILALHLLLHWRWIFSVLTGHPSEGSGLRAGLGIVGFITVIALSISLLLTPVEKDASGNQVSPVSSHKDAGYTIRGSMTFMEIEKLTHVPATYLIKVLKLPESTSTEKQLGQLKEKYGFEINDVRSIINDYKSPD